MLCLKGYIGRTKGNLQGKLCASMAACQFMLIVMVCELSCVICVCLFVYLTVQHFGLEVLKCNCMVLYSQPL